MRKSAFRPERITPVETVIEIGCTTYGILLVREKLEIQCSEKGSDLREFEEPLGGWRHMIIEMGTW